MDQSIRLAESVMVPTEHGTAEVLAFTGLPDGKEHVIFAYGDWRKAAVVNVRVHSECITGDVFGSKRCDCGPQLAEAVQTFSRGSGLIVYLRQEGRGIGLVNKLRAYRLQDQGLDTYAANERLGFRGDERDFAVAAAMLKVIGVSRVKLLSNNPAKASALERNGVKVSHRTFTGIYACAENQSYLAAKREVGGHDGLRAACKYGGEK